MANLGDSSVSSLVSSAASAVNQLNDLKVSQADINYEDSAKTASDLADYKAVVQPLLTQYQNGTTYADISKADSYSQKLITATNSQQSADIKRAQIGIDQGTYSQAQKVSLLANLYSNATDPSDQQSILSQYDTAVNTLNSQNASSASSAASNEEKGYTVANAHATTLIAQISASMKTGKNQIDPSLLGSEEQGIVSKLGLPAAGGRVTIAQLYNLYGMVKEGQFALQAQGAADDTLTADEQASHETQAANIQSDLQTSIYTNQQLMQAEADKQPAIIVKYVNGIPELQANPYVDAAGQFIKDPTPQTIQKSLAATAGQKSQTVTVNVDRGGVLTQVNIGYSDPGNTNSPVIYTDPSNLYSGQVYLYNVNSGVSTPLPANVMQQINATKINGANGGDVGKVIQGYVSQQQMTAVANSKQVSSPDDLQKATNLLVNNGSFKLIGEGAKAILPDLAKASEFGPLVPGLVDGVTGGIKAVSGLLSAAKAIPGVGSIESAIAKPIGDVASEISSLMSGAAATRQVNAAKAAAAVPKLAAPLPALPGMPATAPKVSPAPVAQPVNFNPVLGTFNNPTTPAQQNTNTVSAINKAAFGSGPKI